MPKSDAGVRWVPLVAEAVLACRDPPDLHPHLARTGCRRGGGGGRPVDTPAAVQLPGLQPGDRDGVAAPVVLCATDEAVLRLVPLRKHAVDVPDGLRDLKR
jgi:hypothetical protein